MAHVPAAERRPQLVQAAITLMAREGVAAGSTRAIAAELGVAQATVHYTFGAKKDLYRAVVEQLTAEFIAHVRNSAPDSGTFEEQVRALIRALWTGVNAEPGRCMLLTEFTAFALRDPDLLEIMRAHERGVERTAAEILAALADSCDVKLARPAADIAAYFVAGFDGLTSRNLILADGSHAEMGLELLVATTLDLCRRADARPAYGPGGSGSAGE